MPPKVNGSQCRGKNTKCSCILVLCSQAKPVTDDSIDPMATLSWLLKLKVWLYVAADFAA
jgi:hypothetical protein